MSNAAEALERAEPAAYAGHVHHQRRRWVLVVGVLAASVTLGAAPRMEKLSIEAGLKAVDAVQAKLDPADTRKAEAKRMLLKLARDAFAMKSFSQPAEADPTERAVQWPQALVDSMEAAIFAGAKGKPEVLRPYVKEFAQRPDLDYVLAAWVLNETGDTPGMLKLLKGMVDEVAPALEQMPRENPELPVIKAVDGLLAYARGHGGGAEVDPLIKRFAAAKKKYRARPLSR